jgi:O-antigen ligase
MRRLTWFLLLAFVFAMPWEYSLELGNGMGNIARVLGLLALICAIPAVLHAAQLRTPGLVSALTLAVLLWFALSTFWSVDTALTLTRVRGYFQELMIVWLLWEFAAAERDLRAVLRAWLAGSCVLAGLTLAGFAAARSLAADQIRFAAFGQDPNDVARYLDLVFPLAALLAVEEGKWPWRLLAIGYFPLALSAVVLTASRGGALAAIIALAGSALLLAGRRPRLLAAGAVALTLLCVALWHAAPLGTLSRLATVFNQVDGGDLNQRRNIWEAGWRAFLDAPLAGHGAGTFVEAAALSPIDTAHNTALSVVVEGGLIGLLLGASIVVAATWSALHARAPWRLALLTAAFTWLALSMGGSTGENRKTWLLFGIMAVAGRLAVKHNAEQNIAAPVLRTQENPIG